MTRYHQPRPLPVPLKERNSVVEEENSSSLISVTKVTLKSGRRSQSATSATKLVTGNENTHRMTILRMMTTNPIEPFAVGETTETTTLRLSQELSWATSFKVNLRNG